MSKGTIGVLLRRTMSIGRQREKLPAGRAPELDDKRDSQAQRGSGSTRAAVVVLAVFVAARLVVMVGALLISGSTPQELAYLHDGAGYQQVAAALPSIDALRDLSEQQRRLFPGYPAVIACLHCFLPLPIAALLAAVAGGAAAVLLLYQLTNDPWLAAYFAVVTPSWLVFTSTAMSEGLFLAVTLAAVLAWRRRRWAVAGMLAGCGVLTRLVGIVVFVALWLPYRAGPSVPERVKAAVWFALPLAGWASVCAIVWASPAQQLTSYADKDLALPCATILEGFLHPFHDPLKLAQVVMNLLLVGGACLALYRRWRASGDESFLLYLRWVVLVAGFYLLLPSAWAFECLPRFFVACLPAVLVGVGPWLPRRWWALAIAAAISTALGIYLTSNALVALGSASVL